MDPDAIRLSARNAWLHFRWTMQVSFLGAPLPPRRPPLPNIASVFPLRARPLGSLRARARMHRLKFCVLRRLFKLNSASLYWCVCRLLHLALATALTFIHIYERTHIPNAKQTRSQKYANECERKKFSGNSFFSHPSLTKHFLLGRRVKIYIFRRSGDHQEISNLIVAIFYHLSKNYLNV